MKPGAIGFCMHHDSFLSKAIAWFMSSQWSHSFMIFDNGRLTYTIETSDFRIHNGNVETYVDDDNVSMEIWDFDVDNIIRRKMADECQKYHGKMYGYAQLLSLGIRRLLMRVGIRIPNFIRSSLVCNQLVGYGLKQSGIEPFNSFNPEAIDTQELYDIIRKHPKAMMIYKKGR